jgi:hypothetical protein
VLSFLGLGSSPDAPTWGRMIADASQFIEIAPHALLAPVVALVLMTLSMSVVGNRLREWLDPLRRGGESGSRRSGPSGASGAHPALAMSRLLPAAFTVLRGLVQALGIVALTFFCVA